MKCATFHNGEITPGIQTTKSDKKKHSIIFLGQKGEGSRCRIVFLDSSKAGRPVIDAHNMVHIAYPAQRTYNRKDKAGQKIETDSFVLKRTFKSQTQCLIRINTSTQFNERKRINGSSKDKSGWPQLLANAWGFSNRQKFTDELWIIDDMDAIIVVSAGGGREHRYVIYNDKGDLICTPEMQFIVQEKERKLIRAKNKVAVTTVIEADEETEATEVIVAKEEVKAQPENELPAEEIQDNLSLNEMVDSNHPALHDDQMSHAEIEDKMTPVDTGNGPEVISMEVVTKKSEVSEKSLDTQQPANPGSQSENSASSESENRETIIHDKVEEQASEPATA
jgi:hypothetical protein